MVRILLIDADAQVRQLLTYSLSAVGHDVVVAQTAAEGLGLIHRRWPDLVISELFLPDAAGGALCRALKKEALPDELPLLILSERHDEVDRVSAFECGADDYVAKPFSPRELVLRIRAVLRRRETPRSMSSALNNRLQLNQEAHRTWVEGHEVHLTVIEFRLLAALQENQGRVLSRERLLVRVWGHTNVSERTVDAHIKRLRLRLGVAKVCVETVRGIGYRFADSVTRSNGR